MFRNLIKNIFYIFAIIAIFSSSIALSRQEDNGGGEGGGGSGNAVYVRVDNVCKRMCYINYWDITRLQWVYVIIQKEGTEVHCYSGGKELCTPQACDASCG